MIAGRKISVKKSFISSNNKLIVVPIEARQKHAPLQEFFVYISLMHVDPLQIRTAMSCRACTGERFGPVPMLHVLQKCDNRGVSLFLAIS